MYKNGRPARVVMTDAGLNDYINDISFLPGFDFRREGEEIALLYLVFSRVFLSSGFGGVTLARLFAVVRFLAIIRFLPSSPGFLGSEGFLGLSSPLSFLFLAAAFCA